MHNLTKKIMLFNNLYFQFRSPTVLSANTTASNSSKFKEVKDRDLFFRLDPLKLKHSSSERHLASYSLT